VQLDRSLEEAAMDRRRQPAVRRLALLKPLSLPSLQSQLLSAVHGVLPRNLRHDPIFTASTSVLSVSIWSSFEQANWGLASALSILAMILEWSP